MDDEGGPVDKDELVLSVAYALSSYTGYGRGGCRTSGHRC